jgi:predicted ATPase
MELLFTWIEDYRNIKNQGINFSAEFNIVFDKQTNVLSVTKRQNYIPSFFGEKISNISVIVGENGTGKSSILNIGQATFYLGRNKDNYFLVCTSEELSSKIQLSQDCPINIAKHHLLKHENFLIIQYSNFIDSFIEDTSGHFIPITCLIDLSTNKLARQFVDFTYTDIQDTSIYSNSNPIFKHVHMHISEINEQMNFLLKKENRDFFKFNTPEKLILSFNLNYELKLLEKAAYGENPWYSETNTVYENILNTFLNYHLNESCYHTLIEDGWKNVYYDLKISNKEYALFVLRWSIFLSSIRAFSNPYNELIKFEEWFNLIPSWEKAPIENWFVTFFENTFINHISNEGRKPVIVWAKNALLFISQFESFLQNDSIKFNLNKKLFESGIESKSYGNNVEIEIDIERVENKSLIFDLIVTEYQNKISSIFWSRENFPFLTFSWRGVSSGEIAMLRLFSRFNTLRETIRARKEIASNFYTKSQITHLLFLIDEGEIGLHPTWQQQFLSKLIENIPPMFEGLGVKSIQLILTTHSPFILSDVPNNHVIFLEKDNDGNCVVNKNPLQDKKMTFGANIHSLLSDGFFMKEGLMGDFAKKKINELIDDLIEKGSLLSDERKSEIRSIIPLIGEPIIRKKIMDLYNEQINLSVDDRIKALEKDIEKLKAIKNDSNKKK